MIPIQRIRCWRAPAARRGVSVVELALAVSLLGAFAGMSLELGLSISDAYRVGARRAEKQDALQRTSAKISELMRGTPLDAVTPAGLLLPAHATEIDFAQAVDFVGGAVVWSDPQRLTFESAPGDPADGVDNDGNGLVDDGRVVWIRNPGLADEERVVLCSSVLALAAGEVADNLLDDNGNGLVDEPGLSFAFDGNRLIVELSLGYVDDAGVVQAETSQRSIALRETAGGGGQ